MKYLLAFCLTLLLFLTGPLQAETNASVLFDSSVKQAAVTNANQVMIEILTGIKTESAKLYVTTKEALVKAYDTVSKEAPEVVKEFMLWKFVHHAIWLGLFAVISATAYYWSRHFKKAAEACPPPTPRAYRPDDDHDKSLFIALRYVFVVVALILMLVGGFTNLYSMLKIKLAPRVYIIEYVVDMTTQPQRPQR